MLFILVLSREAPGKKWNIISFLHLSIKWEFSHWKAFKNCELNRIVLQNFNPVWAEIIPVFKTFILSAQSINIKMNQIETRLKTSLAIQKDIYKYKKEKENEGKKPTLIYRLRGKILLYKPLENVV